MSKRLEAERREAARSLENELAALHSRSFGWALSCSGYDREEAADVLQSTYLKVIDGRAKFGGRSLFSTWLFGVIRRTASERRRQRAARRLLLLRHARELEPTALSAAGPLDADAQRLRKILNTLPRRQREVLHLVFYDDRSIREAAEIMQIGLGSARVHYDRAKKRLRIELEGIGIRGANS